MIDKERLLELLVEEYGDLTSDLGCYVGDEWLSLKRIVEIINLCVVWG